MRKTLEHLEFELDHIDSDNLYRAISEIKQVISKLIALMDVALPMEVEDD